MQDKQVSQKRNICTSLYQENISILIKKNTKNKRKIKKRKEKKGGTVKLKKRNPLICQGTKDIGMKIEQNVPEQWGVVSEYREE